MKKSIGLRILLGISGLVFIAEAAALIADKFFHIPVFRYLDSVSPDKGTIWLIIVLAGAAAACLVGFLCLTSMFDHKGRKHYVQQHTESGALDISMTAIESLVKKCTDCHEDIEIRSTTLENSRSGLTIRLRACLASGVNIPLTVSALQKQIRQYVTACSGIDVREVAVVIEQTDGKPSEDACLVPGPDAGKIIRDPDPAPVSVVPQESPENNGERLLHQRLFGHQEVEASLPENPGILSSAPEEVEALDEKDRISAEAEEPVPVSENDMVSAVTEEPVSVSENDMVTAEAEEQVPVSESEEIPDSGEIDQEAEDLEKAAAADEALSPAEDMDQGELDWTLDDDEEKDPEQSLAEDQNTFPSMNDTETDEEHQNVT